jgi:hypothetical protein
LTEAHPRLIEWRERVGQRPAVRHVAGAMARYLLSQGRKLPDFLARLAQSLPPLRGVHEGEVPAQRAEGS